MSKNWSPEDLLGTKHLLAEHRAIEEARIAKNAVASCWPPYKPGWTFAGFDKDKIPKFKLKPYRLALDEFETPDDRYPSSLSRAVEAKDYSAASEGPGQVTVRGSNYDVEEPEVFSPYDATVKHKNPDGGWKTKRRATADEENTLGLDTESDLVGKMTDAVKAWAGMTTPLPKAADPTVEALINSYLASPGARLCLEYQTTPRSKIGFKLSFHPEWAGGTGIPPELRNKKKLFRVRSKISSNQWSNTI